MKVGFSAYKCLRHYANLRILNGFLSLFYLVNIPKKFNFAFSFIH